ncbi:hypothetical protein [Marinifilum fragile]|uniref:hypothetical protein n=1 Tax=Marinifilum fragile TaxID=570161 RepID=UPI002AA69D7A|nr:hypothetical protein [Marinifilum fragile]
MNSNNQIGKEYSVLLNVNDKIKFYYLKSDDLSNIDLASWEENQIESKYTKVYSNSRDEYLCFIEGDGALLYTSSEGFNHSLKNEIVLFRDSDTDIFHPFHMLDHKSVKTILNGNSFKTLTPNSQSDVYLNNFFYEFENGSVLVVDKYDNEGELFCNIQSVMAYLNYIGSIDIGVVFSSEDL